MIRPTAAAIPPRVMMLIVRPTEARQANVAAMVVGTTRRITRLMRQLRKKRKMTTIARTTPTIMLSRVLAMELMMKLP